MSITVGELREALRDVGDDVVVSIRFAHEETGFSISNEASEMRETSTECRKCETVDEEFVITAPLNDKDLAWLRRNA